MKCGCLSQIDDKLQEAYEDPDGQVDSTFQVRDGKIYVFPVIRYYTRLKKKDGTFKKNRESVVVVPNFCPWCGEAIEDDGTESPDG